MVSRLVDLLPLVLVLAAGFSIDDSRTLMIWDQLVDAEKIATEDGVYTNCLGTFPRAPDEAQVCKDTSGELF